VFKLTKSNIKTLFGIFDDYFFNNKLSAIKKLSLFVGDSAEFKVILLDYTNNVPVDLDKYLALY